MSTNSPGIVQGIRVRAVKVPMTPHRTASGVIAESPLVLIDVNTDAGVTGNAILFAYTPAALGALADLTTRLGELIQDRELAPVDVHRDLHARLRLLGTQGLVGMALAGLDMALWDALAKTRALPLAVLLGGSLRPTRAYGAIGFDGIEGSARLAEELVKQGFTGVKAKIGYPSADQDLEVVRGIRSAVGDDIAIMVDYNQSLGAAEAIKRVRLLDDEGLVWVEEPVAAHDYAAHAEIRSAVSTPIQSGENWWGTLDLQHALEAGASDFVMPDVMKIGGVTGWMRAQAMAGAMGIPVSNHLWPEVSAHLLAGASTAHWLEYSDWWNPILAQPLHLESGMAVPSATPGSGIEWNEPAVAGCLA